MTLNVILANLTSTQSDTSVLNGALAVASAGARSHVQALLVRPDPTKIMLVGEESLPPATYQKLIDEAQRTDAERVRRTRALFDKWCVSNGVRRPDDASPDDRPRADFRDAVGHEERLLAQAARLADITVMARPKPENRYDPAFEAVLLGSGHPVLLVPPGAHATAALSNILIAWNDSPEAASAVSAALPLLKVASKVTVFTAPQRTLKAGGAEMLVDYLKGQDVKATAFPNGHASNEPLEEKLLSAIRKTRADLLVMGAYTHSRVRELVFGGVTRHMLTHAPIPVLMSH